MIEKLVRKYLNDNMTVKAYIEKPPEQPEKYLEIERVGHTESNFIYTTTLAIKSMAGSLFFAAELNDEVIAVMNRMIALPEIVSVYCSDSYNHTDTTKKEYRYQAIFEITHY